MNLVVYCPIYNLYFFNPQGKKPFDFPSPPTRRNIGPSTCKQQQQKVHPIVSLRPAFIFLNLTYYDVVTLN